MSFRDRPLENDGCVMLPKLPDIDIGTVNPDVDGLDIWKEDFSWFEVPDSMGVYCFYDANTGEILYVGSACARSNDGPQRGLRMRVQFYRSFGARKHSAPVRKVLEARKGRRILFRCWKAHSAGDARKYECDTIERLRPVLNNEMAVLLVSVEHSKALRLASAKRNQAENRRRPLTDLPAEDSSKYCSGCGQTKMMRDFDWNRCRKDGRSSICKKCKSEAQMARKMRMKSESEKAKSLGTKILGETELMEMMK